MDNQESIKSYIEPLPEIRRADWENSLSEYIKNLTKSFAREHDDVSLVTVCFDKTGKNGFNIIKDSYVKLIFDMFTDGKTVTKQIIKSEEITDIVRKYTNRIHHIIRQDPIKGYNEINYNHQALYGGIVSLEILKNSPMQDVIKYQKVRLTVGG